MERSQRCTMCGTAPYEWEEDPFAYTPVFITCMGCQKKDLLSDDDTPRVKGTTVRLLPKEEAERLRVEQERLAESGISTVPRRRRSP